MPIMSNFPPPAPSAAASTTWKRCTDQYPPIGKQILAYGPGRGELVDGCNMDICIWDGHMWWDEGGTEQSLEPVAGEWRDKSWTHWMPLPAPP